MRRRETGKLRCRELWRRGLGHSSRTRARRKMWVGASFFRGSDKVGAEELEPAEEPNASDLRRKRRGRDLV